MHVALRLFTGGRGAWEFRAFKSGPRAVIYMKYARRLKAFLGLGVLALVALSMSYLLQNPGRKFVPAPVKEVDVEQAEVVIDGFSFSKTEDDDSTWELNARKAEVSKDTGIARLMDMDAVITTAGGTVLNLTAKQGVFDTQTRQMELSGGGEDVTLTSNNGYEIRFKDVSWDNSARELSTDGLVTMDGENVRIEGKGMVARTDLQEVRIVDGVKTVFSPAR